jgi:hypothetical protein
MLWVDFEYLLFQHTVWYGFLVFKLTQIIIYLSNHIYHI